MQTEVEEEPAGRAVLWEVERGVPAEAAAVSAAAELAVAVSVG